MSEIILNQFKTLNNINWNQEISLKIKKIKMNHL